MGETVVQCSVLCTLTCYRGEGWGSLARICGKNWLAHSDHCSSMHTLVLTTFFFYIDTLTNDGSRVLSPSFPNRPPY